MNSLSIKQRIAIVGAGIGGLAAAHELAQRLVAQHQLGQIVLFEAGDYIGGHTHTVDVCVDHQTFGVDTGFLVFNERTYPTLIALFKALDVEVTKSEMSFSVSVPHVGLEWAGTDLNSVFAQRRNLCNPRFLRMLGDILRFNRQTTALAEGGGVNDQTSLGDFLNEHRYSESFRDWYLLPMAGSIWSCSTRQMLDFPLATFIRFCHNHGLLQVTNRPQWYTVSGGARHYVNKMVEHLQAQGHEVRAACPVRAVRRHASSGGAVEIHSSRGIEQFDAVIMACHSDQALALLSDASPEEAALLGSIRYQPNRAVLHTDVRLLPKQARCWAAWNYFSAEGGSGAGASPVVGVSYLLNKLQPLPTPQPIVVTLNPVEEPQADTVFAEFDYAHPVFDRAAIDAQQCIDTIQGKQRTWFAGAWLGYGFHEDGLKAGLRAADLLWTSQYESGG
jgi:uncharacterized protein